MISPVGYGRWSGTNVASTFFEVPKGLAKTKAQNTRERITCASEYVDYVDRHLACQHAAYRASMVKFRSDGILLPFGDRRAEFDVPNP